MLHLLAAFTTSLLVHCYYCSNPNNLFNLVARDVTFSQQQTPAYHQVSVAHQEMCFSHCQLGDSSTSPTPQRCSSFAVQTIKKSQHICSFFNVTYSPYQNLVASPSTLLYSKYFLATDCTDWFKSGSRESGIYTILINGNRPINVKCRMRKGSGWTLIMRREVSDHTSSFMRTWNNYRGGFGKPESGDYWIGNENLHLLTSISTKYELAVKIKYDGDADNEWYYYDSFKVSSEKDSYRLVLGEPLNNGKDILQDFRGQPFATMDRAAKTTRNCVEKNKSGWWYASGKCGSLIVTAPTSQHGHGVKLNKMKIRPAAQN